MNVDHLPLGPLGTNCFICSVDDEALVVDPGGEPSEVLALLRTRGLSLKHILVTHLHFDHIYGCAALARATGAPILASSEDAFLLETEIGGGGMMGLPRVEPFDFTPLAPGKREFLGQECRVLATPGHTPGSLTFYFPQHGRAFVGDLIFRRSVGRTDFPGGSTETLTDSIEREIFTLPPETLLHNGHGPDTNVGDERNHNPFFVGYRP